MSVHLYGLPNSNNRNAATMTTTVMEVSPATTSAEKVFAATTSSQLIPKHWTRVNIPILKNLKSRPFNETVGPDTRKRICNICHHTFRGSIVKHAEETTCPLRSVL
jgi:hypothetical protein